MARFAIDAYYLDDDGVRQTDGITVTLVADGYTQVDNYIDVPIGTQVSYTITKSYYNTVGPIYVTVVGDSEIEVPISKANTWTYNIVSVPANATKSMTGGVYTSSTGSLTVPQGQSISWSISKENMNSLSGERSLQEGEEPTVTETKTLSSTVTLLGVVPNDNDTEVTWTTGLGDVSHEMSVTALCTNSVTLSIKRDGYVDFPDDTVYPGIPSSFPTQDDGQYLINKFISPISLIKKTFTYYVNANLLDTSIYIWKEENGVEVPGSRVHGTGSATMPCVMGDDVHWSAERTDYYTQTGSEVIGSTQPNPVSLNMNIVKHQVAITSTPNNADIQILVGGVVKAQGVGLAEYTVDTGTQITYNASLGGVTVQSDGAITISNAYSDNLVLDATSDGSVTVEQTSKSLTLPYGKYKFVLIGGGGGGGVPSAPAQFGARAKLGGSGGGGGGSGFAVIKEIQISNKSGEVVTLNVGNGGGSATNGGITSIVVNNTTYSANGGSAGNGYIGGAGGSGGGGGGPHGSAGQIQWQSGNGGNGSYGGGNGATGTARTPGTGGQYLTHSGGVGFYNTVKNYESNAGALREDVANGYPGGGGRGATSISSTLTNKSTFMSLTNVQTIYNSLGGGGGGGPTGTPQAATGVYGGPGGGGGGWNAGSAGTAGAPGTGGAGGKGAILYMRVAWS